jgi:hypothetical protein
MFMESAPAESLRRVNDKAARRWAGQILGMFAASFPDVVFDVAWEDDSINAQAYRLRDEEYVRVYGGLARHHAIGPEGLALALAHEVGHHRGGPPLCAYSYWMSTDRQADRWAFGVGMPIVFGASQARRLSRLGVAQWALLAAQMNADDDDSACGPDHFCIACRVKLFTGETGDQFGDHGAL